MRNVADIIRRGARVNPGKTAVITEEGNTYTFKEIDERTSRIANALLGRGVKKGDRVAIYNSNNVVYFEMPYMCGKGGFVNVNVNERLITDEIRYIIDNCAAKVLITNKDLYPTVKVLKDEGLLNLVICTDEPVPAGCVSYKALLEEGSSKDPNVPTDEYDSLLLLYTSGTTGQPKGADLSHHAFIACAQNHILHVGVDPNAIYLAVMPYYHSVCISHAGWTMRGSTVVVARFEVEKVMRLIQQYKVTDTFLVPTMIRMLLDHKNVNQYDLSSLTTCLYAAAPMPKVLLAQALKKFGAIFVHVYGMTENGNMCTTLRKDEHVITDPKKDHRLRSCGKEILRARVRVVNENGEDVKPGEPGELILQSESLFRGYWNDPEKTAKAVRDGWFYSGDIAEVDEDGYLYIVDRKNDLIISGGSNIYPREIEEELLRHPSIMDAVVLGVPHDIWGEAVKAVVVTRPNMSLTEEEVVAYCREHLAGYKVPKSVDFPESLPRDANGKISRKTLRNTYWSGRDSKLV